MYEASVPLTVVDGNPSLNPTDEGPCFMDVFTLYSVRMLNSAYTCTRRQRLPALADGATNMSRMHLVVVQWSLIEIIP